MLAGPDHVPLAVGGHDWENQFINQIWTYSLDATWTGLQQCYAELAADVQRRYDVELTSVAPRTGNVSAGTNIFAMVGCRARTQPYA